MCCETQWKRIRLDQDYIGSASGLYLLTFSIPDGDRLGNEKRRGLQWDMMQHLEDLDFADDITLLL